jgi:hypothetical protein
MDSFDGDRLEPGGESVTTQAPELDRPRLWNPSAAALWCLLFTPAFGGFLHAANWRALGDRQHLKINHFWIAATFILLAVNVGTLFVPESKSIDMIFRAAGIALLIGWYTTAGKTQVEYVKDVLGNHYIKKGWGLPLLIAIASLAVYFGVIGGVVLLTSDLSPDELAAEVKPLILKEWHKDPMLRDATIQNITLEHRDGNVYTGFVDAILGGRPERLSLQVTYDGETVEWEVKPLDDQ